MRLAELEGRRVAVWGLGREGLAALRALRRRLPALPLTLLCSEDEAAALRESTEADELLDGTNIVATEPDAALLRRFDVVVKSPGISPYRGPVPEAQAAGVRFVSGSALWFAEHPRARTIAVTGTKGKSTTAALIAHLLRAAGQRVALCGNIGLPLLELLDPPVEPDWWVMELSSFQTRDLDAVPEIAILLNLFPEHLDWHGSYERYAADKLRLLGDASRRPRIAIVDEELAGALPELPAGSIRWFGGGEGFHVGESGIFERDREFLRWEAIPLPGRHNARNLCGALTAIKAAGVDPASVRHAVSGFGALPHRLQVLGEREGLTWVNDSIATTPHATLAALAFFGDREVSVLVGGFDRGVAWEDFRLGMSIAPARNVIAMGQNRDRIVAALEGLDPERPRVLRADGLEEAVTRARALTPAGGVVLLSPGAPSFGEFRDYVERGRRFAALAGFDPDAISAIEGMGL